MKRLGHDQTQLSVDFSLEHLYTNLVIVNATVLSNFLYILAKDPIIPSGTWETNIINAYKTSFIQDFHKFIIRVELPFINGNLS